MSIAKLAAAIREQQTAKIGRLRLRIKECEDGARDTVLVSDGFVYLPFPKEVRDGFAGELDDLRRELRAELKRAIN